MRTFIYTVLPSSTKRGYNRTISVHELIDNMPEFIGYDDKVNTAAYKGDGAIAWHIVAKADETVLLDGYRPIERDKYRIFEV